MTGVVRARALRDSGRAPFPMAPQMSAPLPDEAVREIRRATALPREFSDKEMRYWLQQCGANYESRALWWTRLGDAIREAEKAEAAAAFLASSLRSAPTPGLGDFSGAAEDIAANIGGYLESLRRHARMVPRLRTCIRADYILIGRDLPVVFEVLYGHPVKGESPRGGGARTRFIIASCAALGWGTPSEASVKKYRDRYNEYARRWPQDADRDWIFAPADRREAFLAIWRRERARRTQSGRNEGPF